MKKQVIGCCIPAAVDAQDKFVCREHVELDFSFTFRLQSAELEHLTLFYLDTIYVVVPGGFPCRSLGVLLDG